MPIVTVTPLQTINVRVGPGTPAEVQSTSTFYGASDVIALIDYAIDTANAAYVLASSLSSQVTGAYAAANAAFLLANNASTTANSALSQVSAAFTKANSAYALANTAVQQAGGVITGNLTVNGIIYGNVAIIDAGTF